MTDSSNAADAFRDKVIAMAEEAGIETLLLIFRDPDTHTNCSVARGDSLWVIGALRVKEADMTADYLSEDNPA